MHLIFLKQGQVGQYVRRVDRRTNALPTDQWTDRQTKRRTQTLTDVRWRGVHLPIFSKAMYRRMGGGIVVMRSSTEELVIHEHWKSIVHEVLCGNSRAESFLCSYSVTSMFHYYIHLTISFPTHQVHTIVGIP